MKYRATISFSGNTLSMAKDEVRELSSSLASEFVKCGYLKKVTEKAVKPKENKRD